MLYYHVNMPPKCKQLDPEPIYHDLSNWHPKRHCTANASIPTFSPTNIVVYSKYCIFCTYFSNISVVFLSNDILLYTVGKLFLIPIQWCYSHIPTVRNAKVIFKIHHFIVFNSLTFVSTRAPTHI